MKPRESMRREAKALAKVQYPGMHAIVTAESCLSVAQWRVLLWTITFWDYTLTETGVIKWVNVDSINVYFGGEHEHDFRIVPKIGE